VPEVGASTLVTGLDIDDRKRTGRRSAARRGTRGGGHPPVAQAVTGTSSRAALPLVMYMAYIPVNPAAMNTTPSGVLQAHASSRGIVVRSSFASPM
jgi:hypothetical protein